MRHVIQRALNRRLRLTVREEGVECLNGGAVGPPLRGGAGPESGNRSGGRRAARGQLDLCLCMTVNPGSGGQFYIATSTKKIQRVRELLPDPVALQVDGGITVETVGHVAHAGANLCVAGSSVFGSPDPGSAYLALREALDRASTARPAATDSAAPS